MDLLKIIKNNLFIQNFAASIISSIPPYLEFSVSKYFAIKKAMYVTAHDSTHGSYLEFGVLLKNPDLIPLAGDLLKIKASLKVTETYGW